MLLLVLTLYNPDSFMTINMGVRESGTKVETRGK